MFDWLRRLWRSRQSEKEKLKTASTQRDNQSESARSKPRQESGANVTAARLSSEQRVPVLVRGDLWKNTKEVRWELAPERDNEFSDPKVEELIKKLGRVNNAEVRRDAAEGLGQLGSAATSALPDLLNAAIDVDASVRKAATNALSAIDPEWPKNAETRKAFPHLVASLKSWSSDISTAAYKLLAAIGSPVVADLINALADESTIEQVYIMQLLTPFGPQAAGAIPALTKALGSQNLQIRIAAAQTLTTIGPAAESAVPALIIGLADPFADGRQAMASCLAHVGTAAEPAAPVLLRLLADKESKVRKAAATVLAQIGPQIVPALMEIIKMRDYQRLNTWLESLITLSQSQFQNRPDFLITDSQKAQANLAWAAYSFIEKQAALESAQVAALHLLGKFGSAASIAVPTIAQALTDPNPNIQRAALQTLGEMGPEAQTAIPALTIFLEGGPPEMRAETAQALKRIHDQFA